MTQLPYDGQDDVLDDDNILVQGCEEAVEELYRAIVWGFLGLQIVVLIVLLIVAAFVLGMVLYFHHGQLVT